MKNPTGGPAVIVALALVWLGVIALLVLPSCGEDPAETTRAAQMRAILKENADLRAELQIRRLPESDQVEAFKQERIEHAKQLADMARQLEEARTKSVDPALASLQTYLTGLNARVEALQAQTARDMQDIRNKLHPGDSCHCGQ